MTIKRLSAGLLAELSGEAQRSPRARQHRNFHTSYQEPCQRLLNAIGPESYIRPHRHAADPKIETLVALQGSCVVVTFEQDGAIREIIRLATERYGLETPADVGVELSPDTWHTVIALEAGAVLLELKAGPFDPAAAKELAPWAPAEGTPAARAYFENLRARALESTSRPLAPGVASTGE